MKEFNFYHRESVIKLIEKKERNKRLIKNWRLSLLNIDWKNCINSFLDAFNEISFIAFLWKKSLKNDLTAVSYQIKTTD